MGRLAHMDAPAFQPHTVDFYLYSAHEIAVFEPVWRSLRQRGVDAQLVLEPPGRHRAMGSVPNPERKWFNDLDGTVVPLVDDDTFAAIAATLDERGLPWIEHSRVHADAVLTTQGVGWLLHYGQTLRIRMEYGASAFVDVYGHGQVNQGLDAVLAHGPFSARAISAHLAPERIHQVGYPKWSPALAAGLDRDAARAALDLPTDASVVAWLPTWAHNAGIDDYGEALAELADHHLVVAKPHHNNVRFERDRLAAIDPRIVVRADLHSLVPLVIAADAVVADSRSGALAETIIANRPAVGLLPGIDARANGMLESFDDAVVWCQEPGQLGHAIADALAVDRSAARDVWRSWLFGDAGAADADRAAATVIELIDSGRLRGTAGLPLSDLDVLIDETGDDQDQLRATLHRAWPLWPGHPRLTQLVRRVAAVADPQCLLPLAQLVRSTGHQACCPLTFALTIEAAPVRKLVAAALAAEILEDATATEQFGALAAAVPDHEIELALHQLAIVPTAIAAFVHASASSPARCRELARALNALGAQAEAAAVDNYGKSLVPQ